MSNLTNHQHKIQIICGPTASGKTALALRLAEARAKAGQSASIISADSRQIYIGLDIVSGKDIPVSNGALRFFGFDLCQPNERFSAGQYSNHMREIIDKEIKENRQIIIVGGTGFYLKALVQPATLTAVPPNGELRQSLEKLSVEQLQQKLKNLNPERFASMNQSDASNPRRLIRAIEVALSPRSIRQIGPIRPILFSWIGIRVPLDDLKRRIEKRVRDRLDHGAIAEIEALLKHYPDQNLPVYTTLGVKPIIKFIGGEIDQPTLIETWTTDEVNYAKRQLTWFKKQSEIVWYDQ